MKTTTPASALVRAIGLRALTASIFNIILGAGIFVLPAKVAALAGPSTPLVFGVCGLAMMLVLICFAMAGSRVSLSGGPYAYIEFAFGPATGFVAGFLFLGQNVLSAAALANAFAQSLSPWIELMKAPAWRNATVALLLTLLAAINIRGTRQGSGLIEISTLAKLLPLGILIAVGLGHLNPQHLAHPQWSFSPGFGSAALLLFFAFSGGEMALQASGEIREANRTVPRALLIAGVSITLFYLALQLVVQSVFGDDLASHSDSALADAAAQLMGPLGRTLMMVGLIVSLFGWLSGDMLNTPRTLYAFASDGFIPRPLAWVHPRFHTPAVAIGTHALLVTLLAANAQFERLANLSSLLLLLVYLLGCLAAWTLDQRDTRTLGEPFHPPGARILPWVAVGAVLWFMAQSSREECFFTACVLGLAVGLYLIRQKARIGRNTKV